jgi:8-oxo-dGTP diphosphatase
MLKVKFHEDYEDQLLKYAVIVSQYGDHWVFCKHKQRNTYECPGGHREPGEDILTTAERELFEETGAISYTVREICPYSVTDTSKTCKPMACSILLILSDFQRCLTLRWRELS